MLETRLQTEIGRRGWQTSAELVVENADEELIQKLDLIVGRFGGSGMDGSTVLTFCKVEARPSYSS
jgi:hypothetical protein